MERATRILLPDHVCVHMSAHSSAQRLRFGAAVLWGRAHRLSLGVGGAVEAGVDTAALRRAAAGGGTVAPA
eukprot:4051319-Pleurochrysis_carterae.AAC.2